MGTVAALRADAGEDEARLNRALDRSLARQALPTLVAGGLRRFVPAHRLEDTAEHLGEFVRAAVREGFTARQRTPSEMANTTAFG